mmetsp:Transcript_36840/g.92327  ORF Transcript_36840/g.92327 Transcript_36840/m.92327 type:complete len:375 (-) Transcript_36840:57-1181(-)
MADLDLKLLPHIQARKRIGIITGSGPEAGIDLWNKLVSRNRERLAQEFKGDLDAPKMLILSAPSLGYSMDMDSNYELVWTILKEKILEIGWQVDVFAITCNTLHTYADRIKQLNVQADFVSYSDICEEWAESFGIQCAALLGGELTMEVNGRSPYRCLTKKCEIELPADIAGLHQLIFDVKRLGPHHPDVKEKWVEILLSLNSSYVLLCCTELPLVAQTTAGDPRIQHLSQVDVTELVAEALLNHACGVPDGVEQPTGIIRVPTPPAPRRDVSAPVLKASRATGHALRTTVSQPCLDAAPTDDDVVTSGYDDGPLPSDDDLSSVVESDSECAPSGGASVEGEEPRGDAVEEGAEAKPRLTPNVLMRLYEDAVLV